MIVLRAERLPATWTIMFPTFRVCKSVFEKRNPQVWIVIGFPLLSPFGARVHLQIAWASCATARRSQQAVVKLNSKVPVRDELKQNARKSRSKTPTIDFLPMQERPSVKKLLAYEKEVNEGFAKTA